MRTLRNTRRTPKKRITRKQSGGRRFDMRKLHRVIAKRARVAEFAKTSAKMAQKLKDRIDSL